MMKVEKDDLLVFAQTNEVGSEQIIRREIERLQASPSQPAQQFRLALRRRKIADINEADGHRLGRADHLHGMAVDDAEIGPKNFVAAYNFAQTRFEHACTKGFAARKVLTMLRAALFGWSC
jgi:hypothetical protein